MVKRKTIEDVWHPFLSWNSYLFGNLIGNLLLNYKLNIDINYSVYKHLEDVFNYYNEEYNTILYESWLIIDDYQTILIFNIDTDLILCTDEDTKEDVIIKIRVIFNCDGLNICLYGNDTHIADVFFDGTFFIYSKHDNISNYFDKIDDDVAKNIFNEILKYSLIINLFGNMFYKDWGNLTENMHIDIYDRYKTPHIIPVDDINPVDNTNHNKNKLIDKIKSIFNW